MHDEFTLQQVASIHGSDSLIGSPGAIAFDSNANTYGVENGNGGRVLHFGPGASGNIKLLHTPRGSGVIGGMAIGR